MTTPNMKPGWNFGGGSGKGPSPFRFTFIFVGVVFLILGFTSNPVFFGSGIIFIVLGLSLQDGDGKGPGDDSEGVRPNPKDDSSWARKQREQHSETGVKHPKSDSEGS